MPIDKEKCLVGMKVQDTWGNVGIVRWIGRIEKAAKPPRMDVGTYAAVEFERAHRGQWRCDGTWSGHRYCTSPPGTVEFLKPRDLSPEMNTEGVRAVRAKLGDRVAHMPDAVLVKFLIARKYELPKVVEMIENDLKWRAEFKPDPDEYFPPDMALGYPSGIQDGYDKEGNFIVIERPGNGGAVHPKDWVKQWGVELIARWHAAAIEEGRRRQAATGFSAPRVTMIVDLSKMGDSDRGVVDFAKAIGKIDQDHYPEHLAKMYIINAPGVFTGLWRIIKIFVDDRTTAKIKVMGSDYREELLSQIDESMMPSICGGSNDSWLSRGGRVGGEDPARKGDTATVGDLTSEPPQVASASPERVAQSPTASSPAATPTDSARSGAASASPA